MINDLVTAQLDAQNLRKFEREIVDLFHIVPGSSNWELRSIAGLLAEPHFAAIVTRREKLVGLVVAHTAVLNPQVLPNPLVLIRRLVVRNEFQGAGVALHLLTELSRALNQFRLDGSAQNIGWQVRETHEAGSGFFGHIGFTPRGRISVADLVDLIYIETLDDFQAKITQCGQK